ncbi:NYN domain-containing protein [Actinomadura sp. HBU206391]|uniref:NYN domain-containing protein n=1 Tax=Actinomadura sp. HBU206391 TaxID=2731692 RepID=UPI00164F1285|nr:NYN domain-containing protein [Actinomadura sp. HBU206391]MBC6457614.1 NYN domain-containing protein [Actinomadura sp. HBU206391]
MDRSALFVDAGYLLADGAMAVHGTRHRETVSWDFGGLLQLLSNLTRERTGLPLLRCYWYEATIEGRRASEHEALADLPGLKLRLGRIRPGRREGVDTEIHRDLTTLARNGAIADAVVVSGDEDLAQVVSDAQALGVRVTLVHVSVDGNWTISRVLRQECDDLIEIGAGHLRPYVNALTGADSSSGPLSNGHSTPANSPIGPLKTGPHSGPPPGSPITGQPHRSHMSIPARVGPPSHTATGAPPNPSTTGPMHAAPTPAQTSAPVHSQAPSHSQNLGSQYISPPPQQHGPYTGPQQIAPVPVQQNAPTLSDAVKSAHQEGQDFGESVARDAPALWLEAVLARKPRMPSDLEARLLQGSSLPIDFLLHDEVRHALRRGFWDALERSRR